MVTRSVGTCSMVALALVLLLLVSVPTNSFSNSRVRHGKHKSVPRSSSSLLIPFSTSDGEATGGAESKTVDSSSSRPDNLVKKETLMAAVDALKLQITKETGEEFPPEEMEVDGNELVYLIGRLDLQLSFAPTPPNLALTDSPTGLTVVAAVGEGTADSGIQPFDTITAIGADGGSYRQVTTGMSLADTTATLTAAANHAVEKGQTTIEIEVNRLMKGFYR